MTGHDTENAALNKALEGYTAEQRAKALKAIAGGRAEKYASDSITTHTAWRIQSSHDPNTFYVVVDDGDYLWCPCPARGNCWHQAVAIMMRVHDEHATVRHLTWCPGNPATSHVVARKSDPVCCDLDVRSDANAYDPFAVFDRL